MARLDEIAEGIATVLGLSREPEPLPVELVDEGPAEVTLLVRAIVDSCRRSGTELDRICLDPQLGGRLFGEHGEAYKQVRLVAEERLADRIEIWRRPAA